jgi:hypothetical protein
MGKWSSSVSCAASEITCTLEHAWRMLPHYELWNPTFAKAEVRRVSGRSHTEGDLVLITKDDGLPSFYSEIVRIIPGERIVWYAHPKEGTPFRKFIDFSLASIPSGVRFCICCYEELQLRGEALETYRKEFQASLHNVAIAFKTYCESTLKPELTDERRESSSK